MLTLCNHLLFCHGSLNANILLMQCNQTCAPSPSDSLTNGLPRNRTVSMTNNKRNHTRFNGLPCNQTVITHGSQTEPHLVQHSPRPHLVIISKHRHDFSRLSHSPSHHILVITYLFINLVILGLSSISTKTQ